MQVLERLEIGVEGGWNEELVDWVLPLGYSEYEKSYHICFKAVPLTFDPTKIAAHGLVSIVRLAIFNLWLRKPMDHEY